MRNFQCWLDLQHYDQHLKNLTSIKNRSPINPVPYTSLYK
jgi:hypothetical protein